MKTVAHPFPLAPRPVDGHKGLFGRLLIVGGNDAMIGAPALAGAAALRLGAGLVQIAVPRSILTAALTIRPELIGLALDNSSNHAALLDAGQKADAIVIGPGLGQKSSALGWLRCLVSLDKPMVVDADALNLLAAQKRWPSYFKALAVLTPHPGEMQRLAHLFGETRVPQDDSGRLKIARAAAIAFGQVIVLKGHRTIVTDGRQAYFNNTGDSSLSKAGTGDVLSGMLGTLLAQRMDHFDAACAAVYMHGRCGQIAGRRLGRRCVLSQDVIDAIPQAVAEYERRFPFGRRK